jgi:hypothetical protein
LFEAGDVAALMVDSRANSLDSISYFSRIATLPSRL